MANKQNLAKWEELNEVELERASYLINSDELIIETLGESIRHETGKFTKSLHIGVLEDIKILQFINSPFELMQNQLGLEEMTSNQQYKCPTCKNEISITKADFINEIAMTSCGDCGINVVAMKKSN